MSLLPTSIAPRQNRGIKSSLVLFCTFFISLYISTIHAASRQRPIKYRASNALQDDSTTFPSISDLSIYAGTAEIYFNGELFLFGGVSVDKKEDFLFTKSLRRVTFNDFGNGTSTTTTTHLWNDTSTGTGPESRAYSKMFLSDDARYIFIKGGTNRIQSFKNAPDIQFWTDSFDLVFPPYCIFKDLWRFDTQTSEWSVILKMPQDFLPENQQRLLCSLGIEKNVPWRMMVGLLMIMMVALFSF